MSAPRIVTRAEWGAKSWTTPPIHVDLGARDYFLVHYHGGPPRHDRGDANAKEIEAIHLAHGWIGVGYNFIVGQDGVIREGRGWENIGAHCPGFNTRGIGVYGAVGGADELSALAKASIRWLRDEQKRRRGTKGVNTSWHGQNYPTACCGGPTIAWVKSGMPANGVTSSVASSIPKVLTTPTSAAPRGTLRVDGKLGAHTIEALQSRLTAAGMRPGAIDGDAGPSTTKALQRYLNAKLGGADLIVDGVGFAQDGEVYKTVAALQRWLATPVDGKLSVPVSATVKRLQDRLNRHNF